MHRLLVKLLKKRDISDTMQLSEDEKSTFDQWQRILSEGEVTVDKLAAFCEQERARIELKMREAINSDLVNQRLLTMFVTYGLLLEAIKAPRVERERLEKQLHSMIEVV